jgi:ADP-ribosylglycohydrolase
VNIDLFDRIYGCLIGGASGDALGAPVELNRSLIEAANFGRDCDTIATIVGCLGGALTGAAAIRQDWIETCEQANRDLFEELDGDPQANFYTTAGRLHSALLCEKARAEERVRLLESILG